jgi:hypothetical protein
MVILTILRPTTVVSSIAITTREPYKVGMSNANAPDTLASKVKHISHELASPISVLAAYLNKIPKLPRSHPDMVKMHEYAVLSMEKMKSLLNEMWELVRLSEKGLIK